MAGAVLGGFGLLALLLAAVGLYGVMAYSVSQRLHEMGVRIALGAQARDVVPLVVGQGLAVAGIGAAIGVGLALAAARLVANLLYGISPADPVTFVGVPLALLAVAFVASYLPARRAAKADPIVVLRNI